ncbi:MAG: hypothetical protein NWS40_03115 [Crocinitomicaceae bacterium]|jgi:hypothetical protein|nr:hypothetical protein [Crocinitomicaceae bacterium]MDP4867267.1 hypothetical protein [Crocinitomicaceae bacterium]MDP5009603.1 hypothetical protein [Crocinitomicaceae bacterium]
MREGILGPRVDNVAVAIVEEKNEANVSEYYVYLLNLRDDIMEGIIVTSTGYGENATTGERVKTSTLRHSLEILLPNEAAKIEPIMEEVFGLANEFWVSFWVNDGNYDGLFDKKFVFLPETITTSKMKLIPILGKKGIIIK